MIRTTQETEEYQQLNSWGRYDYQWWQLHHPELSHKDIIDQVYASKNKVIDDEVKD